MLCFYCFRTFTVSFDPLSYLTPFHRKCSRVYMEINKRAKYADNDEDDDIIPIFVNQYLQMASTMMDDMSSASDSDEDSDNDEKDNQHAHKKNSRSGHRVFDHQVAKKLIYFKYLGPYTLFNDKHFY